MSSLNHLVTVAFAIGFGLIVLGLVCGSLYWIDRKAIFTFKTHSKQVLAVTKRLAERNLDDGYLYKLSAIVKMTIKEIKDEREQRIDREPQIIQECEKVPVDQYTKANADDDNYKTLAMLPDVFAAGAMPLPKASGPSQPFPANPPSSGPPPPEKEADDGHYENIERAPEALPPPPPNAP